MAEAEKNPGETIDQRVTRRMREVGELVRDELRRRGMTKEEIRAFLSRKRNRGRKLRA
jgi:hypothetical protein